MKSILGRTLVTIALNTSSLASASQPQVLSADDDRSLAQESQFLDTDRRPEWMRAKIQAAFDVAARSEGWRLNGAPLYKIGGVNEYKLILKMILDTTDRNDFYVLDVGCGLFKWGEALQGFLNEKIDEQRQGRITVHIVGMTGGSETGVSGERAKVKCCKLYGLPLFQIESIKSWKQSAQWPFPGTQDVKFDLVVSRSTFQHLADPVGTLVDTYNFVRPEGFLIADILPGDLRHIAHCFQASLCGLDAGCADHALSLIARGGTTPLNIPATYNPENTGAPYVPYVWLTDKTTPLAVTSMAGSRTLAEYLLESGVVEVPEFADGANDARRILAHYKRYFPEVKEISTDAHELIELAKRLLLKAKYLSDVQ
jgi:SAM-dependent methyltransferase